VKVVILSCLDRRIGLTPAPDDANVDIELVERAPDPGATR